MSTPPRLPRPGQSRTILWLGLILLVLLGIRSVAYFIVEYQWWREVGQVPTWIDQIIYSFAPVAAASLLAWVVFWIAHARGMKFADTGLGRHPLYAKITTAVLLLPAVLIAAAAIDTWDVVRYFGGRAADAGAQAWRDPVFGRLLGFYLFDLPFYTVLLRYFLALAIVSAVLYWITGRAWQLRDRIDELRAGSLELELVDLRLAGAFRSVFLRVVASLFLLGLAGQYFLDRYRLLYQDHGFLVGVDYVNENVGLPLIWLEIAACFAAVLLVWLTRWKTAAATVAAAIVLQAVVPRVVSGLYVKPNEISLERPYIQRHIQATRSAFGLSARMREIDFEARLENRVDPSLHKAVFDNVRLWDWRAFHDTVTQIQALRPYYVFADSDVDRYTINGQLRQTLLTPRELDIRQVADARTSWINSHFIYTHGYGLVMAEANRITADGLPVLYIQNAPPEIAAGTLKLTRPEIYYGEVAHEPVFVRTGRPEFNYPSGSDNVHSRYEGTGGFPVGNLPLRLAAALARGDWNILLTGYLTGESRMMIRRRIADRVEALAGFLAWDPDPYLVLTPEGRLVWMIDGYTSSDAHPYSRSTRFEGVAGPVNYIRNSVKATVDAYDGTTRLYIFDPADPVIQAYARLFPQLLRPASDMPAALREHARYPELIFRVQAEMYRRYHMTDPESFYNSEDLWDVAKNIYGQGGKPEPVVPTYVVASLPGEDRPEFLLITPFTPRNKDNLIGLMVARCDGENLGEMVVLRLSKQSLVFGPMQIEARINQDQNISKDLTLWNQQGSHVLRGQMLVLPVEKSFVYIEPIYIQASEARMPQLKKVVVAMGNNLIYTDTYQEALAQLTGLKPAAAVEVAAAAAPAAPSPPAAGDEARRLNEIRDRLRRYRDHASQGRWSEAGRELEAIEKLLR